MEYFLKVKFIEVESRKVIPRDWGEVGKKKLFSGKNKEMVKNILQNQR